MFKVYHSNDLELLAVLGLRIAQAQPLLDEEGNIDPFKKERVLVQSDGMKTYIFQKWASETGIAFQLQHDFIWSYVWKLGRLIIPGFPSINPYDRKTLTLNIIAIFADPDKAHQIATDPDFAPIHKFLNYTEVDIGHNNKRSNDTLRIASQILENIPVDEAERIYELADQLADIYDQYQVYRMDWIEEWSNDKVDSNTYTNWINHLPSLNNQKKLDPKEFKWQAKLWHDYIRQNYTEVPNVEQQPTQYSSTYADYDRTKALRRIIEVLNNAEVGTFKNVLPQRLMVYGVTSLAPVLYDIFLALSRHIDVHYMFTNPCCEYWGDLQAPTHDLQLLKKRVVLNIANSLSEAKRWKGSGKSERHYKKLQATDFDESGDIQIGNSLLLSYGKQGRDSLALLVERTADLTDGTYGEIQAFVPITPRIVEGRNTEVLLDVLKADIFAALDTATLTEKRPFSVLDKSITLHSCTNKLREVQVAYDHIVDLFVQDPTLRPRDIIVMMPNIRQYAPYIESVFNANNKNITKLPFAICDRSLADENPVVDSLKILLHLNDVVLSSDKVFELFKTQQIRDRFEISVDDLDVIREWIDTNNIVRGLDQKEVINEDGNLNLREGEYPLTFSDGLSRLLYGSMMPEVDSDDEVPYNTDIEGDHLRILGNFYRFITALIELRDSLDAERTIEEWQVFLQQKIYNVFYQFNDSDLAVTQAISREFNDMNASISTLVIKPKINLNLIRHTVDNVAVSTGSFSRFLRDKVNFCTFVPMRSIPFKHVMLLGMNDGDFPRTKDPLSFDVMNQFFRKGDRSSRNDDRYMFLEALLAAQDSLYISYLGRSADKGVEFNPSILVSELLDYIDESFAVVDAKASTDVLAPLVSQYLLQQETLFAYDDSNFASTQSSYQYQWLAKHYQTAEHIAQDDEAIYADGQIRSFTANNMSVAESVDHAHTLTEQTKENRLLYIQRHLKVIQDNKVADLLDRAYFANSYFMLGRIEPDANGLVEVRLADVIEYYQDPAKFFLRKVLGIYNNDYKELAETESFTLTTFNKFKIIDSLWGKTPEQAQLFLQNLALKGVLPLKALGSLAMQQTLDNFTVRAKYLNEDLCRVKFKACNISLNLEFKDTELVFPNREAQDAKDDNVKITNVPLYDRPIKVHLTGTINNLIDNMLFFTNGYSDAPKVVTTGLINLIAMQSNAIFAKEADRYYAYSVDRNYKLIKQTIAEDPVPILRFLVTNYLIGRVKPLPIFKNFIKEHVLKESARKSKQQKTDLPHDLCQKLQEYEINKIPFLFNGTSSVPPEPEAEILFGKSCADMPVPLLETAVEYYRYLYQSVSETMATGKFPNLTNETNLSTLLNS